METTSTHERKTSSANGIVVIILDKVSIRVTLVAYEWEPNVVEVLGV